MKLNILFEDNHIIVVEKVAGILSQADHTEDPDMLTMIKHYLKETYNKPGNVFLGLVHRLDRMVGGVMVFAKTSKAASRLSEQVRTHEVTKKYLAVIHGEIKQVGTLQNYLLKDTSANVVSVVDEQTKGSKHAVLDFQRLDYNGKFSLVDVNLKTGRPHQIRVQFSYAGHPLYGDIKYGNPKEKGVIALYAYALSFNHPTIKERMTFTQLPKDVFPFNEFKINI